MVQGKVKWFSDSKGYGFIEMDDDIRARFRILPFIAVGLLYFSKWLKSNSIQPKSRLIAYPFALALLVEVNFKSTPLSQRIGLVATF